MKPTGPQNPNSKALIRVLNSNAPIWRKVAEEISSPQRSHTVINVDQLDRLVKENEMICFPGKILGMGLINKKITIAALNFSSSARAKIEAAGGTILNISEMLDKHPKGSGIRIVKGEQIR